MAINEQLKTDLDVMTTSICDTVLSHEFKDVLDVLHIGIEGYECLESGWSSSHGGRTYDVTLVKGLKFISYLTGKRVSFFTADPDAYSLYTVYGVDPVIRLSDDPTMPTPHEQFLDQIADLIMYHGPFDPDDRVPYFRVPAVVSADELRLKLALSGLENAADSVS